MGAPLVALSVATGIGVYRPTPVTSVELTDAVLSGAIRGMPAVVSGVGGAIMMDTTPQSMDAALIGRVFGSLEAIKPGDIGNPGDAIIGATSIERGGILVT